MGYCRITCPYGAEYCCMECIDQDDCLARCDDMYDCYIPRECKYYEEEGE